jgi:hypothetical protein
VGFRCASGPMRQSEPDLSCEAETSHARRRLVMGIPLVGCHTRFSVENQMHLICVPGSQFDTYDRLMSVISQDIAQKRTEKVY